MECTMRIGTWNVENRLMTEQHRDLILKQECDVWLLTEVNRKWADEEGTKILGFNANLSKEIMGRNQHWAAVLSVLPLERLKDPHEASAAARSTESHTAQPFSHGEAYKPTQLLGMVPIIRK